MCAQFCGIVLESASHCLTGAKTGPNKLVGHAKAKFIENRRGQHAQDILDLSLPPSTHPPRGISRPLGLPRTSHANPEINPIVDTRHQIISVPIHRIPTTPLQRSFIPHRSSGAGLITPEIHTTRLHVLREHTIRSRQTAKSPHVSQ